MVKSPKRPTLEEVLEYKNPTIINGFVKHNAISYEDAADLFEEVKCMLWLCREIGHDNPGGNMAPFRLDSATRILDEMWHNFFLFSQEYHDFCFKNFGEFLHHQPTVEEIDDAKNVDRLDSELQAARHLDEMRVQYRYVYAKLGKERFLKWYVTYKEKYSPENIIKMKIKAYEKRYGELYWPEKVAMPMPNLRVVAG